MPENDHYRTLNIQPDATQEEIQKSYRALARRYHPDLNPQPSAARAMAAINAAYEVLSEPLKRAAYDKVHKKPDSALSNVVLGAAREALLRKGWSVQQDKTSELILKNGSRAVHVALIPTATSLALHRLARNASALPVVLTAKTEPNIRFPKDSVVVIDVLRSTILHGVLPDATYRDLFSRFI